MPQRKRNESVDFPSPFLLVCTGRELQCKHESDCGAVILVNPKANKMSKSLTDAREALSIELGTQ